MLFIELRIVCSKWPQHEYNIMKHKKINNNTNHGRYILLHYTILQFLGLFMKIQNNMLGLVNKIEF